HVPKAFAFDVSEYFGFPEFFKKLGRAEPMRGAVAVMPKHSPHEMLAATLINTAAAGYGAIGLVPDYRDLEILRHILNLNDAADTYVELHASLSPATRYTNYLKLLRDEKRIVIGTRNAVFAPVAKLKTIAILDDADDSFAEAQSPYWHAREVAALRSQADATHLLAISHFRSVEVQQWVQTNWAKDLLPDRTLYRKSGPIVRGTSEQDVARDPLARHARIPGVAFNALKQGLQKGPVLISVPRRGYQLHLQCQDCRTVAHCGACGGGLQRQTPSTIPSCMWCGLRAADWKCDRCNSTKLRTAVVGAARTAEEIGRAFPGIRVITSGKDHIVGEIENAPALVIATPGAEPIVNDDKYQAVVILDPELSLGRADLRAEEESYFRWLRTLSLAAAGAPAVIAMPDTFQITQLLIRLDPIGFATRELQNREAASITPVFSTFEVILPHLSVSEIQPPAGVRLLGPVPVDDKTSRMLILCPRAESARVASWLKATVSKHSAAKIPGVIHVKRDPVPLH
ncbi:MAG: hypothetical protein RL038_458, partial [Actinomycetota bacterium]